MGLGKLGVPKSEDPDSPRIRVLFAFMPWIEEYSIKALGASASLPLLMTTDHWTVRRPSDWIGLPSRSSTVNPTT